MILIYFAPIGAKLREAYKDCGKDFQMKYLSTVFFVQPGGLYRQ